MCLFFQSFKTLGAKLTADLLPTNRHSNLVDISHKGSLGSILSMGTVSHEENEDLAKKLKVPLDASGFFLEAHMKLRPVDFATDGVYLCGMAHAPKTIEESISQAKAAAAAAARAPRPAGRFRKCATCARTPGTRLGP